MHALMERFLSNIDNSGDCWIWLLGKDKDGYGRIKINGKTFQTHRVSWELHVGPIPKGLLVLHKCDVTGCVNPDHLWVGTTIDNNRDREAKGRGRYRNRTHCLQGHKYNEKNTYFGGNGRRCRVCMRDAYHTRRAA